MRLKEQRSGKLAAAEHSKITGHSALFEKSKVLANIPFYCLRKERETT